MTPEQEHLLYELARAVANLCRHVSRLSVGETTRREIEIDLAAVERALREAEQKNSERT